MPGSRAREEGWKASSLMPCTCDCILTVLTVSAIAISEKYLPLKPRAMFMRCILAKLDYLLLDLSDHGLLYLWHLYETEFFTAKQRRGHFSLKRFR